MAGTNSAFNPAIFRAAVREAMNMGLPESELERATFRWTASRTYTKQDSSAKPWDWTDPALTEVEHDDVQIPVAIEFSRTTDQYGNTVGQFDLSRAVATVLDDDYQEVIGADTVLLGGNQYRIEFVEPPVGLFSVTVYRLHLRARDES